MAPYDAGSQCSPAITHGGCVWFAGGIFAI